MLSFIVQSKDYVYANIKLHLLFYLTHKLNILCKIVLHKKINNDTINEVANALPLIQKIINSLNSTIIKTTTNGDKINTSITDIYNVTVKLADLINEMNTNLLKQ